MTTSRRRGDRSRGGGSRHVAPGPPRGFDLLRLRAAARLGYGGAAVEASGVYLLGPDREQYLDAASGADTPLGHAHPALVAAAREALDGWSPASPLLADPARLRFAGRAARLSPAGLLPLGLFGTGRAALDAALALARLMGGREAVVLEPLPASTFAPRPEGEPARLAGEARRGGALVVSDERALGAGRLGTLVAAEAVGLPADLIVVGGLGGGIAPATCLLATPTVARAVEEAPADPSLLAGGDGAAGPLAAALAAATLEALADGSLAAAAAGAGEAFGRAIKGLESETEAIVEVTGRGLAWAVECAGPEVAESLVRNLALDRILVVPPAPGAAVVRLVPPLVVETRQLDFVASSLAHACEEL